MNEADLVKATSHGLRGMRERAQQFGGDVSVSSQPGRGPRSSRRCRRRDNPSAAKA
jgi:signal transduction histidine kinase